MLGCPVEFLTRGCSTICCMRDIGQQVRCAGKVKAGRAIYTLSACNDVQQAIPIEHMCRIYPAAVTAPVSHMHLRCSIYIHFPSLD